MKNFNKNFYSLKSERLKLVEISINDLDEIHSLHSIPEVDEFNTLGIPGSLRETKEFMQPIIKDQLEEKRKHICWTAREINRGEFIGLAGLVISADRFKMAEIYFKLLPKFWGNGYATELAIRIFQFGFDKLDLHRIEAGVATENTKSIRVLEKLGMTREGIRRKILPIRGVWKDNYHYAILDDEFK
jgi:RimJ/RimL family protein N-acetyltransferase